MPGSEEHDGIRQFNYVPGASPNQLSKCSTGSPNRWGEIGGGIFHAFSEAHIARHPDAAQGSGIWHSLRCDLPSVSTIPIVSARRTCSLQPSVNLGIICRSALDIVTPDLRAVSQRRRRGHGFSALCRVTTCLNIAVTDFCEDGTAVGGQIAM